MPRYRCGLNKGFFRERDKVPGIDPRCYLRLLPLTKLSCLREEALAVKSRPSVGRSASYLPQETEATGLREGRSHARASTRVDRLFA